jgi:peptide deformylase
MKKIVQRDAGVLREIARDVPVTAITSPQIRAIVREMRIALASQEDGVALAAPQIGYSLRMFVVSDKVAGIIRREEKKKAKTDLLPVPKKKAIEEHLVFINPVIKKLSREKKPVEEGCLSVRYLYGTVSRSTKALVEAYDEHGRKFSVGGTGLLAQIFQHETDHLNGILFIDKAKHLEEIPPEKTADGK